MNMNYRNRNIFLLATGGGAVLMAAAIGAYAQATKPMRAIHPVPPVVAPANCANGFSQTSASGQPGSAQFAFACKYPVTCPPGTEAYLSINQVSGTQTGQTTATFTYGCNYADAKIQ